MATRGGRSAHGSTTMVLLLLVVATLLVAAAAPKSTKITLLAPPAVPDDAWVVRHIAAAKRNASGTLPSRRRGLQGKCHSPDVCNPLPPAVTD
jgi:acyl dehydratase